MSPADWSGPVTAATHSSEPLRYQGVDIRDSASSTEQPWLQVVGSAAQALSAANEPVNVQSLFEYLTNPETVASALSEQPAEPYYEAISNLSTVIAEHETDQEPTELSAKKQSAITQRLRRSDVVDRVNQIQAQLEHNTPIRVANSFDEFPVDVQMDALEKAIPGKAVKGNYAGGELYINLESVKSLEDLEQTINEELYGHFGFHQMYGLENRANMASLYQAIGGDEGFERLCAKYDIDLSAYQERLQAQSQEQRESILAEELLAHLAATESPTVHNRLQTLYGGLRHWWRENGFTKLPRYNNADIAHLLHQANKAARHGPTQKIENPEQIIRRLADSKSMTLDPDLATSDDLVTAWTLIGADESNFSLPRTDATDFEQIADQLLDVEDVTYTELAPEERDEKTFGADRVWQLDLNTRRGDVTCSVSQRGTAVWIDVSRLQEGEQGKAVYNAVANYAHNNGLKFIGDPTGLSDIATHRRLENMISSALKFGTTAHLAPHPRQLEGTEDVPALDWRDGEHEHNLRQMISASYFATLKQVPNIEEMIYNAKTGELTNEATGYEYTDQDLYDIASAARQQSGFDAQRSEEQSGEEPARSRVTVGRSTIARAVITQTLLRREGQDNSELLAQIGDARAQRLNGILYSLSTDPEDWGQAPRPTPIPKEWLHPVGREYATALDFRSSINATPPPTPVTPYTPLGRAQQVLLQRADDLSEQSKDVGKARRKSSASAEFYDTPTFISQRIDRARPMDPTRVHSSMVALRDNARAYRKAAYSLSDSALEQWQQLEQEQDEHAVSQWFQDNAGVTFSGNEPVLSTVREALNRANSVTASPRSAVPDEPTQSHSDDPERLAEEVTTLIGQVNAAYEADDLDRAEALDVRLESLMERIETGLEDYEETLEDQEVYLDDDFDYATWDELLAGAYYEQYETPDNRGRFLDEAQFISNLRENINNTHGLGYADALDDEQIVDLAREAYEDKANRLSFLRERLSLRQLNSEVPTGRVPDPEQARPQPPLWLDATLKNEGALFQFAGSRSLTANTVALAAARQFSQEGHDKEQIRQKTGWLQGEDGNWRYEISDDQAALLHSSLRRLGPANYGFSGRLGDILDHPELYAAYPDIVSTTVSVGLDPSRGYSGGHTPPGMWKNHMETSEIRADAPDMETLKQVLLHEIQHEIQYREQFSCGANSRDLQRRYTDSLQGRAQKLTERLKLVNGMDRLSPVYAKEAEVIERELQHIDIALEKSKTGEWARGFHVVYEDVYGEREARLTEERRALTPEDRERIPPHTAPLENRQSIVLSFDESDQDAAAKLDLTPAASITLLPQASIIKLTQAADRTSFLHEGAHLFLDMEAKSSRGKNPDRFQLKILDYLEVNSLLNLDRESHEKFARGFEQYLTELEAPKRTPNPMKKVFGTVKNWFQNTYTAAEELGEPLSPAAREMYAELMSGYEAPEPANLDQAEKHERRIAMELQKTGLYPPGEAYTNAKMITAYALAKAQRDPDYPTVDRVFDQMNLRIESATKEQMASQIQFDWDSFDIRAVSRKAQAVQAAQADAPGVALNNYDLSREARRQHDQNNDQTAGAGLSMTR